MPFVPDTLDSLAAGLVFGVCLYVINLPYMLLMFRSSFFRPRFRAWLDAGSLPLPVHGASAK